MAIFDRFRRPTEAGNQAEAGMIPSFGQMLPVQGALDPSGAAVQSRIGEDALREALLTLQRYKDGKKELDRRLIEDEEWWRLRSRTYVPEKGTTAMKTKSAWLVNVILSKHADAMDAIPEATFLPREQSDEAEATVLHSIVPLILDRSGFERSWSDVQYKKLKSGIGIYGVFWDSRALNGLGEIAVRKVDPLNLFWEPGITDLQKSRDIFHVELVDNDTLTEQYPQLDGKLSAGTAVQANKYIYAQGVDTSRKSAVIDWYYHRTVGTRKVLHYVKFVGETVLYATEDDPALMERGLYDHGMYPFFADVLFPLEGSPAGFGYIDLCKDPQRQIDLLNDAIITNSIAAATPRWLKRGEDGINEKEYADWTKPFVHVQGSIEENVMKPVPVSQLSGNYLSVLQLKVDEMKETSGNRDVANGGTTSGVTAASAIAAMQEQSGKLSRDMLRNSYGTFKEVVNCVIELIRQFYDAPRAFRVLGDNGLPAFVWYQNTRLRDRELTDLQGNPLGNWHPVFDIEVAAAKQSAYSTLSYNELAMQLYQNGFFNPAMAPQALMALDMMDFKGKEKVRRQILEQYQLLMGAPQPAPTQGGDTGGVSKTDSLGGSVRANNIAERAKAQAAATTQPR